jgi:hypothetical protein
MSEFTEEKRAKALLVLNKIIEEDKDKYHVYHDIYHALQDSCNCRIPENKILPGREDLVRFLHKKMLDHEVHGRVHERLIELVENLIAVDTIPAESSLFHVFRDPEDYAEALRGHHLCGAETLESLKLSPSRTKKRSRMGETENKDKDSYQKKKNFENL